MKKLICFTASLLLFVLIPFRVFAINADMITKTEAWYYSDIEFVNKPVDLNDFSGMYSYYPDIDDKCFYLHISYYADTLKNENNNIKVYFDISNQTNSYKLIVNENGFDEAYKSDFNVLSNFSAASKQGQDIYIAIEFKDKYDKKADNYIDFYVEVNGEMYKISETVMLPFYVEETTTEKTTKATEKTTGKSTEKKAQKAESETKYKKMPSETTTKFKYVPSPGSNSLSNYSEVENDYYEDELDEEITEEAPENAVVYTPKTFEEHLSPASKALIAVSAVIFISGAAILGYCLIPKNKKD